MPREGVTPTSDKWTYVGTSSENRYRVPGRKKDDVYEAVVVPRSQNGARRGPKYGSSKTIHLKGKTDQPLPIQNAEIITYDTHRKIVWNHCADSIEKDIAYYEVREGGWWGARTVAIGYGNSVDIPFHSLDAVTYYIKSRDKSDNWSDEPLSLTCSAVPSDIYNTFGSIDYADDFTANGTLVDLVDVSGVLRTDTGVTNGTGVYTGNSLDIGFESDYYIMVEARSTVTAQDPTLDRMGVKLDSQYAKRRLLSELVAGSMEGSENRDMYDLDGNSYALDSLYANIGNLKSPKELDDIPCVTVEWRTSTDDINWSDWISVPAEVAKGIRYVQPRVTMLTEYAGLPIELSLLNIRATNVVAVDTSDMYTSLTNGGQLSINGSDPAKFDISSTNAIVVDNYTDPLNPVRTRLNQVSHTAVTVTNLATQPRTFVSLDASGNVVQQANNLTPDELRDLVYLGLIVHPNGTSIQDIGGFPVTSYDQTLQLVDFVNSIGPMNDSGNIISANGANLSIDRSAGTQYRHGANYDTDRQNPSIVTSVADTALTFRYRRRDGSGGYIEDSDTTVLNVTQYDDGTGTLATISGPSKFQIVRIWAFASGTIRAMYGQNLYKTIADAEASLIGETFDADPNLKLDAVLRGWIIVKNNVTALNSGVDVMFIEADRFGGAASGGVSSSTTTLQQAYINSSDPAIELDGPSTIRIEDSAAGIGANFLQFDNNGGTTTYFGVDANGIILESGGRVKEFSTDGTLAGDVDTVIPTEKAVKTYVDTLRGDILPVYTMIGQRAAAVPAGAFRRVILDQLFNSNGLIPLQDQQSVKILAVSGSYMNDTSQTTGTWIVNMGISLIDDGGTVVTSVEATTNSTAASGTRIQTPVSDQGTYESPLATYKNVSGKTLYMNVYIQNESSPSSASIPGNSPYQWVSVSYLVEGA